MSLFLAFWSWDKRDQCLISVATQFLTHVLINFQKNSKIAKNIENKKKYIFNTFASFLAFLASSQKNLNFQTYLEHVQLLTRYFLNHWFSSLSRCWFARFQKIQKKSKFTKKRSWGTNFENLAIFLPINTGLQHTQKGGQFCKIEKNHKKP